MAEIAAAESGQGAGVAVDTPVTPWPTSPGQPGAAQRHRLRKGVAPVAEGEGPAHRALPARREDLDAGQRRAVFDTILALPAAMGDPHTHAGLGLRKLHRSGIWRPGSGFGLRLVFWLAADLLALVRVGSHEDVRRFLRNCTLDRLRPGALLWRLPGGRLRKLVECVPNFSEGRDRAVIDAIAEAIRDRPAHAARRRSRSRHQPHGLHAGRAARGGGRGALARRARGPAAHRHAHAAGRAPAGRRARRLPVRAGVGRDDGRLRGARERVRPPRGRGARRSGLPLRAAARGRAPPDACSRSGRGSTKAWPSGSRSPSGSPTTARPPSCPSGRDRRGRARLPDRLQRQRPGDQGAGPPHRPRHPRGRPRPGQPGEAEGGARDRLVGRGVRPGAGLDQPRGLPETPPHVAFEAASRRRGR